MSVAIKSVAATRGKNLIESSTREINPREGTVGFRLPGGFRLPPPNIKTAGVTEPSSAWLMLGGGAVEGVKARQRAQV